MKVLITIGFQTILLPNDAGVASLMKTLSKALLVESDRTYHDEPFIRLEARDVRIEMKYISEKVKILKPEPAAEEELLGLPMHLLGLPEHGTRQA